VADVTGRELFRELARQPDDQVDLALGALLLAEEEYPELDRQRYLDRLQELGEEARSRLTSARSAAERVQTLAQLLAWDATVSHDKITDVRGQVVRGASGIICPQCPEGTRI